MDGRACHLGLELPGRVWLVILLNVGHNVLAAISQTGEVSQTLIKLVHKIAVHSIKYYVNGLLKAEFFFYMNNFLCDCN